MGAGRSAPGAEESGATPPSRRGYADPVTQPAQHSESDSPTTGAGPAESAATAEELEIDEAVAEDVPLNRAERRARAKGDNPSHVGPQAGRTDQGRGPRSHTKRQIG